MGIAFNLSTINWLAHVLKQHGPVPRMQNAYEERESLARFLDKLPHQFFSSRRGENLIRDAVYSALDLLRRVPEDEPIPEGLFHGLRELLSDSPWIGLIIPSMENNEIDKYITSSSFLREIVYEERWPDHGIILQPEDFGTGPKALLDVFPSFQVALDQITRWPGMLFWTPNNEASFFPFDAASKTAVRQQAGWLVAHLLLSLGNTIEQFEDDYSRTFPNTRRTRTEITTLMHISDLHIGSKEAAVGIPRLQSLLRTSIAQIPREQKVISVVTGDLIDSPRQEYHDFARAFVEVLRSLTAEPPVMVLGNHDVRDDGYLSEDFRMAIRMPTDRVRWFDEQRLGFVCFNSVIGGNLAAGRIGQAQFGDVGNEIDQKSNWQDYTLLGVLHHHPVPVAQPDWYVKPLYERVFGRFFDRTDKLEDARDLIEFATERKLTALLHGHKHIPRVTEIDKGHRCSIIGCGSSIGKVPTNDGRVYLSINRIDIDRSSGRMFCRLMAERTLGAGVKDVEKHEIIYSEKL